MSKELGRKHDSVSAFVRAVQEIGERHGLLYTMVTIILFTPISDFLAGEVMKNEPKSLKSVK